MARAQLRPLLPKYEVAAGLLFEAPTADLLRGLTFQGSSFDRSSFYLVAFVQRVSGPALSPLVGLLLETDAVAVGGGDHFSQPARALQR